MAELWNKFQDILWTRSFWLPDNVTWEMIYLKDDIYIAKPRDLWMVFPTAVCLILLRFLFERYIARPIGLAFNLSDKSGKWVHIENLEDAFLLHRQRLPDRKALEGLSKQTDLTERQIERWWRKRTAISKPSKLQKFTETAWRFFYYISLSFYGFYILWDKPWFWDNMQCFYGWPMHHVTSDLYWYYVVELGFYWSLVLSSFMDVKRKDFYEMLIHHFVTILLMSLTMCNNFTRVGALVLVLHDLADYWLEAGKLLKYLKMETLCTSVFAAFTVVWFLSRNICYPYWFLYGVYYPGFMLLGPLPVIIVIGVLLLSLLVLHYFWFVLLVKAVYGCLVLGKVSDTRSGTESSADEEETTILNNNNCVKK